jgi:hypothetical protein
MAGDVPQRRSSDLSNSWIKLLEAECELLNSPCVYNSPCKLWSVLGYGI